MDRDFVASLPEDPEERRKLIVKRARKRNAQKTEDGIRAYVELLKSQPCSDCGEIFAPESMDFDHRPGEEKDKSVSDLVRGRYSPDRINSEIAKCDLVCANCHIVRTRNRIHESDDFPPFVPFPKIPRYRRTITVTEKIDGTNAKIIVCENGEIFAGGRNRWLSPKIAATGPDPDQFGFAAWVAEREDDLWEELGPGIHSGEWYGFRINRGYEIKERRFALFNPKDNWEPNHCAAVPIIYTGPRDEHWIDRSLELLATQGSYAVPGYRNPEGIVIFDHASRGLHKITLEKDEAPKGRTS